MPFQPGQSGNPGGRPKEDDAVKMIKRLAQEKGIEALGVLAEIALGGQYRENARVAAAEALLNRGFGKPAQTISGDPDSPLQTIINVVTGVPRD